MQRDIEQLTNVKVVRRNVVLALIASIIIASSFIIFTPVEKKTFYGDIIEPTSTAIAAGLSLVVVYRQKMDGLIGKAYLSLAIALLLWLTAEVIWSYYETGLGIPIPTPSLADAFWLIGYGPFMYYVFKIYNFFHKSASKPYVIVVISLAAAIYLAYIVNTTLAASDLSTQGSILRFVVNIAYPISDMILIVPTSLVILESRRKHGVGDLTSIPWVFMSFLIVTIADSGFAYASNSGWSEQVIWIWSPLYIAGYLVAAAGLYWHNHFFIFDEKKVVRKWQEQNR
jgi:hypothetical protein